MILVHLSSNGKPSIIDPGIIMFAEEIEIKEKDLYFTRIYLKEALPDGDRFIDVQEGVKGIIKQLKAG